MQQKAPKMLSVNFSGCTLPDAVGTLHRQGATGRLTVHYPKTPGAFHFKDGKLLDARVGAVVGFQAVHMAMSLPAASFNFEPFVEPERQTITESSQDLIFDLLFRPSAGEPSAEETSAPTAVGPPSGEARPSMIEAPGASNVVPISSVAKMAARPAAEPPVEKVSARPAPDAAFIPDVAEAPPTPDIFNLRELFKETPHADSHQRRAILMAGAVVTLVVIAVAVVAFSGRTRGGAETTPDVADAAEVPASQPTIPDGVVGEAHASPLTLPDGESGWSLSPAEQSPPFRERRPAPPALKEAAREKAVPRPPSDDARPTPIAPADPGARNSERAASTERASPAAGHTVTVVMQVTNGRVTQASIANSRPGMEAYEASALRMARGRRFPPGTDGQEKLHIKLGGQKQ